VSPLRWLIDKSALVRLTDSREADVWSNRIERGLVHVAGITRLEVGFSAPSGEIARREFREPPLSAMPV
jgi:predicted nucleic acid-binding protein